MDLPLLNKRYKISRSNLLIKYIMVKRIGVVFSFSVTILLLVLSLTSCEKKDDDKDIEIVPAEPSVGEASATMIGQNWASMKGSVKPNSLQTIVTFEYGNSIDYGNSIKANPDTLEKNIYTSVTAALTGLEPETEYYFRLKAVNSLGTVYSDDTLFTTLGNSENYILFNTGASYSSLTDIEGNIYKTIEIGSQTWMAENLRTLKLNDGTDIPYIEDASDWNDLDSPAYCLIKSDTSIYGALYNWYTVDSEKLCPEGWSVPSDQDWSVLIDYLGGQTEAALYLKEAGTRHWTTTNINTNNDSGFTALPGGYRNHNGTLGDLSKAGYFWSSTIDSGSGTVFFRSIYYGYNNVDRSSSNQKSGFSVRCIEDPVTK